MTNKIHIREEITGMLEEGGIPDVTDGEIIVAEPDTVTTSDTIRTLGIALLVL